MTSHTVVSWKFETYDLIQMVQVWSKSVFYDTFSPADK